MSESKAKAKVQRKTIIGNITANMRYEVLEHPGIPDIDVDAAEVDQQNITVGERG